jgi:hypothetical protein
LAGAESSTQLIERKWTQLPTTAMDENAHIRPLWIGEYQVSSFG